MKEDGPKCVKMVTDKYIFIATNKRFSLHIKGSEGRCRAPAQSWRTLKCLC